jgi:hypothetical protein
MQEMKRCPLCRSEAFDTPIEPDVCCSNPKCLLHINPLPSEVWQALPRQDETAFRIEQYLEDLLVSEREKINTLTILKLALERWTLQMKDATLGEREGVSTQTCARARRLLASDDDPYDP